MLQVLSEFFDATDTLSLETYRMPGGQRITLEDDEVEGRMFEASRKEEEEEEEEEKAQAGQTRM